jgi:hypothetical protein
MWDIFVDSVITIDEICTRDIKSWIALLKSSIQQEEDSFHQQIRSKFNERN